MPHSISNLESLFEEAMELPLADRAHFLQSLRREDPVLAPRLEGMIAALEKADQLFLRNPIELASEGKVTIPKQRDQSGERLGRYKLLAKLGEGGCGVVYEAQQQEPIRRQVAVKIIKAGMDTQSVIARFEAERHALALMDHPNIAKVIDAGSTDTGRPYFVMELVEGNKITEYCSERQLSLKGRLHLFLQVCEAVQHAHQKGIIHRDLKPSNILVSEKNGTATAKVIDFGIAKAIQDKLTNETIHTLQHQFLGTPAYMSPEQADLSPDIDTRTDIYSLGVLLYELLTGRPPFDNHQLLTAGLEEMRRIIREVEPKRPTQSIFAADVGQLALESAIDTDLECIVLKCLEKDRSRRYETASALAADIRRHLADEPITARPQTLLYRFRKTFRRHRTLATATALVVIALVLGGVTSALSLIGERAARQRADRRLNSTLSFVNDIFARVAPKIRRMAGAASAQKELGQTTLQLLKELRADSQANPEVRAALAGALVYLSRIEGNLGEGSSTGDYPSALEHGNDAIALLSAVPAEALSGRELQLLVDAKQDVAIALQNMGKGEAAAETLTNTQPLLILLDRFPEFRDYARNRRFADLTDAGYALVLAGRSKEGLDRYIKPALTSDWARAITTNSDPWQIEILAGTYGKVNAACEKTGDFSQMLQAAEAGLPFQEFLVRRFPGNTRHEGCLAGLHATRGLGLVHAGRAKEGFAALSQSRTEIEALVNKDPVNEFALVFRAHVACLQTRAFLLRALQLSPGTESDEFLARARNYLSEAEQFTSRLKGKPSADELEQTRAEFAAAEAQVQNIARSHPPPK